MNISDIKTNRVENIELVCKSSQRIEFGDQERLRGREIISIDTQAIANQTHSPNYAMVNATVFKKGFLVLVAEGEEAVNRIPLTALNPAANNGQRINLNGLKIDWPKSYVWLYSTDSVSTSEAFYFNVYFNK